ncbi:MAG TPA: hypothetical protein VH042_09895 [Solirubrobacterales bacterium]|nr:hypothetical protein [Solirubrobacterales bacterium]
MGALALLCAIPAAAQAFSFLPGAEGFSAEPRGEGGMPEAQAGSHPQALALSVALSGGDLRDLSLELPPGLIEDPAAIPTCSQADFARSRQSPFEESLSGEDCPAGTQVGIATVTSAHGGGETRSFGVFNLDPPPGAPSEIGFSPYGAPIAFVPEVRQAEGEYGITLLSANMSQLAALQKLTLTLWGTPYSVIHDAQRGDCLNETEPGFGWSKCQVAPPRRANPLAYLTMPTSCEGPLSFTASATSWQGGKDSSATEAGGLGECEALSFHPTPAGRLSNPRASSPSGYEFEIAQDTGGVTDPTRRAPSAVRAATVTLPEGVTINPSVGAGLGVCTPAGYAAETPTSAPGQGCPGTSKIGDFTVKSPLFEETVSGAIFLAQPYQNPFGQLIAVYLVAKAPGRGILVKVAGKLEADPNTGRLTASFDRLPQLPYSSLLVHFREGQRSPLASPPSCGSFSTSIDLVAWRDASLRSHTDSPAQVGSGVGGGPCPQGLAPFAPTALAGSVNSQAGAYSSFYLHLRRTDVEQEITHYSAQLPPGLLGKIAGVPFCPEGAIDAARHRSGTEELEHPDCPASSLIGHTYSGYGLGPVLSYAPGSLYLAGPYHGSPLSIVALDSALVGPFDLGTVIVRSAIDVDPQTAQVSIDSQGSDPIPHILDGIPIHLRDVRVYVDRPGFVLNPTNCNRFSVASTLSGSGQRFSDPADDTSAQAIYDYQAFNCVSLGFKPRLSLALKGGTKRGSNPSLRVTYVPRPGDANLASAQVTLPPSLFLAQNHIETVCTRGQFAREACPPGSAYGTVAAFTPLLEEPLRGKAYLRSGDNVLPDLVFALRGRGVHLDLAGKIDSVGGGLRGSFEGLPDAPVSKFVLKMNGGRRGVVEVAESLCRKTQSARALLVGQSNQGLRLRSQVKTGCANERRHRKTHKHSKKGRNR